jgi:hypothetical protein
MDRRLMKLPVHIPAVGPILRYHAWLHGRDPKLAEKVLHDIRNMLQGPGGATLLEVLEKAIQLSLCEILGDPRALEARNAQGFILTDLQRIASDEYERILAAKDDAANSRRGLTRRNFGP